MLQTTLSQHSVASQEPPRSVKAEEMFMFVTALQVSVEMGWFAGVVGGATVEVLPHPLLSNMICCLGKNWPLIPSADIVTYKAHIM